MEGGAMRTFTWGCLIALSLVLPAEAQTVVPLKGQSSQQMQQDMTECNGVAANAASGRHQQFRPTCRWAGSWRGQGRGSG